MDENSATIHWKDGKTTVVRRAAVSEFRNLLGEKIARVTYGDSLSSPSVQPKEKEIIKPKPATVEDDKPVKPDKLWKKADIHSWIDKNYPSITYQANDTKEQLLAFIKAAEKAN